jgi:hypothetical protein
MSGVPAMEFKTSGSTGRPKSVFKTLASLDADAAMLVRSLPDLFAAKPYILATIREEHMFGALWRMRVPALAGCEIRPGVIVSVEELLDAAQGHDAVLLLTTPSFLENALKNDEFKLLKPFVAGIVTSGSLLSADLAGRVREALGVSPTEIFGSTEAGSVAWRRQAGGEEWTVFDEVSATVGEDGLIVVDSAFSLEHPLVMGDRVEFTSSRRFRLLGRADRNVKILEKYVSLPELEDAMRSHTFIAKSHAIASDDAVPRIHALVELTEEGRRWLKDHTYSELTAKLKREIPEVESFAFPRRVRYLSALPYNEQGKLPRSTVAPVLASRYQEPVFENETFNGDDYSAELTFIPDAFYFDGHFRQFKILPGVVQIDCVERCIRRLWRMPAFAGEIARLKFQCPIQPREKIFLKITRRSGCEFAFALSRAAKNCTSGQLRYGAQRTTASRTTAFLAGIALSFLSLFAGAATNPRAGFENALRRALDSDASWTSVKTAENSPLKIKSEGKVSCIKGGGIFWQMIKPVKSSITMEAGQMKFEDSKGVRTVAASEMPHYREIRKAVDGFFEGGSAPLEKLFKVKVDEHGEGWRAVLVPKRRDIGYIVKSIVLSGAVTLDEAVFTFNSGEVSSFRFSELPRSSVSTGKGGK